MPSVRFVEENAEQTPRQSDRIYLAFSQLTERVSRWSTPEVPAPASTHVEVSATADKVEANEEQTPRQSDRIYLPFGELTERVSLWSIPEVPAPASTHVKVSATTDTNGNGNSVGLQLADMLAQQSQREQISTLRRELAIPKKSKDAQVALIAADILGINETEYKTEADLLDVCLLTVRKVEQTHREGVVQSV